MKYQDLRDRTCRFALATIDFCRKLPGTWEARRIGGQLFDAGTAVGANYRAAQRGRSDKEFVSKIGVVIEEADESAYWLELLEASQIAAGTPLKVLLREACELRAIFGVRVTCPCGRAVQFGSRGSKESEPGSRGAERGIN